MAESAKTNTESNQINITKAAIDEVKRLMAQEKEENLYLRLGVAAGGCSGMSYTMAFDTEKQKNDQELNFDGLTILVDTNALAQLNGTTLDFKGGLLGGGFAFSNPNARRSCGCGSSFSC